MKKIPLNEFAYNEVHASGIGERNTVSNGPDNGANNQMASHFWNVKRHGSTSQAVDNALIAVNVSHSEPIDALISAGGCNIGGHGSEGQLETGVGQNGAYDKDKWVLIWNEWVWGPLFQKLVPTPITVVSIWSCHTGAGPDGADLLYALAKRIGRAARARTGFTYNNDRETWFENGSVWQVATPDFRPNPIAAPTPHFLEPGELMFQSNQKTLAVTDVTEMRVQGSGPLATNMSAKSFRGTEAVTIVSSLFHPTAMEMNVSVMGFVTARISLLFKGGDQIDFDVYNDRLAVDQVNHTGYYLRPGFGTLLNI